jgi:hypothetical protein
MTAIEQAKKLQSWFEDAEDDDTAQGCIGNVFAGLMSVRWDEATSQPMFSMTETGKQYVEAMPFIKKQEPAHA